MHKWHFHQYSSLMLSVPCHPSVSWFSAAYRRILSLTAGLFRTGSAVGVFTANLSCAGAQISASGLREVRRHSMVGA